MFTVQWIRTNDLRFYISIFLKHHSSSLLRYAEREKVNMEAENVQ